MTDSNTSSVAEAARWIAECDALVISAGAGMGVDSGLPDFRGDKGFWNAYPPYAKLGLSFVQMANPAGFARDPAFAWGFYGHRLHLYRETQPHAGFERLRRWADRCPEGGRVFTSNIDGGFQTAGFTQAQVTECHGSLHWLQCSTPCCGDIWSAGDEAVAVDMGTMRATGKLPTCTACGDVARPNVLMFGDGRWLSERSEQQEGDFMGWLRTQAPGKIVIVECGAGTAVPTVRGTDELLVARLGARLIRINPREPEVPEGQIGIAGGANEILAAIDASLPASFR